MAFAHMGIYVVDMAKMVNFYTGVLGLCITDRALIRGVNVVFLSRDPDEHHQIVLVPGRDPAHASTINQISFRVVSFPELRRIHTRLVEDAAPALNPTHHAVRGPFTSPTPKAIASSYSYRRSGTYRRCPFPSTSVFRTNRSIGSLKKWSSQRRDTCRGRCGTNEHGAGWRKRAPSSNAERACRRLEVAFFGRVAIGVSPAGLVT